MATLLTALARKRDITKEAFEQELGKQLGVTRATVRAWGTGHARPQTDAQARQLFNLAKQQLLWSNGELSQLLDCIQATATVRA